MTKRGTIIIIKELIFVNSCSKLDFDDYTIL